MCHLGLKCNFHTLFKCAHPHVPILLCTTFVRHLVAKDNFHVLMACYPTLVIIFHSVLIRTCTVIHSSCLWCSADHYLTHSNFNFLLTEMITPHTYIQFIIHIYIHIKPLPVPRVFGACSGSP